MLGIALVVGLAAGHSAGVHEIVGRVRNRKTEAPIEGALVVLQCACLAQSRETFTDEGGSYRFSRLPAGRYTVMVLVGNADVSKVITVGPPAAFASGGVAVGVARRVRADDG
jgi:hypothetical protein